MEALFILLGEALITPLIAFVMLLIELMLAFLSALGSVLQMAFGITLPALRRKAPDQTESKEGRSARLEKAHRRLKLLKWASVVMGGLFVLTLSVVLLLNYVFFEQTLRWALGRIESRTGIHITFESAAGNFFRGQLHASNVSLTRQGSATSNFDLNVDSLVIELPMSEILSSPAHIQRVTVSGVRGELQRVAVPNRLRVRRQYQVDHLRLEQVHMTVQDSTRGENLEFELRINELDSLPLRSNFAVFDLLFRSNASGEILGRPFSIATEKSGLGRRTSWQVDELPVTFVGRYLGGPFDWLDDGTVDVRVEDEWALGHGVDINMHWSFVLHDIVVKAPEDASIFSAFFGRAVEGYLKEHARRLEVSFGLVLNESQFEGAASVDAAGLWDGVRNEFVRSIASATGHDSEQVDQGVQKGIDAIKGYLNERRKKSLDE